MTKIPGQPPPTPPQPAGSQRDATRAAGAAGFQADLERAALGSRVPDGRPLDARTLTLLVRLLQQHLASATMTALTGRGDPGGGGGLAGLLSPGSTHAQLQARQGRLLQSRQSEAGVERARATEREPASAPARGPAEPTDKVASGGDAGGGGPYAGLIREAAQRYDLPEDLVRAVVQVESDFRPGVVSSAGAQGLMQLMPETAKDLEVEDPFDPRQNIMGGARYLKQLLGRYDGDRDLALAAYNWGMGNLERHPDQMPDETVRYIKKVNSLLA